MSINKELGIVIYLGNDNELNKNLIISALRLYGDILIIGMVNNTLQNFINSIIDVQKSRLQFNDHDSLSKDHEVIIFDGRKSDN